MTPEEIAIAISEMPARQQDEVYSKLKGAIGAADAETVMMYVAMVGIFRDSRKYNALKAAVIAEIVKHAREGAR